MWFNPDHESDPWSPFAGRPSLTGRLSRALLAHRDHLLLCALVAVLLLLLEAKQPYYFFQDDNRGQNLPYFVQNIRSLAGGEIPLFNFHQFLGTPLLACVQSATFYPFNYLAVFCSRLFLGHDFGTMEFLAFFHLIVAALGCRALVRHWRLSAPSGLFAATAWVFSGFVIVVGGSWIVVLGFAAYQPWLTLFSLRLTRRFDRRAFCGLVLLRSLQVFLGYPQLALYCAGLESIGVVLVSLSRLFRGARPRAGERATAAAARRRFRAGLLRYALHYVAVAVVVLPLLLPVFHQIGRSAARSAEIPWAEFSRTRYNLADWVQGLVNPFATSGRDMTQMRHLYFLSHLGYLPLLCALLALFPRRGRPVSRLVVLFAILAGLAFLLSSWTPAIKALHALPGFNRFRYPFKFQFFTSFYLVMLAALGFERLTRAARAALRSRPGLLAIVPRGLLALHVLNLALVYLAGPHRMFGSHRDPVPWQEPLAGLITEGRFVSLGFPIVDAAGNLDDSTVPSLGYNYATLWGLDNFAGYEAMLSAKAERITLHMNFSSVVPATPGRPYDFAASLPLEWFRRWGVRWYVVSTGVALVNLGAVEPVFRDGARVVLRDPLAAPLVSSSGGQGDRLAWSRTENSLLVRATLARAGDLRLNFLYDPFFKAFVDGTETPVVESAEEQLLISVPEGAHVIRVVYTNPSFTTALFVSGALAAGTAAGWLLRRSRARRRPDFKNATGGLAAV